MKQKLLFSSIALTCLFSSGLYAVEKTSDCESSPSPMRVTARHIEGKGVGYDQGYTTLEGFFTPVNPWRDAWLPFADLRGHVFNNGKLAANGGIGGRYLTSSRVWGANFYYDYRNTSRQHYNQISAGLESLGKIWDFRVNGYLPVGNTKSRFYHTKFDGFKDHYLMLSRKRDFSMKGANAEAGAHVNSLEHFPLYFAAGSYLLTGQGKVAWGGTLRATIDVYDYVRIEGNTSYDNVFKWIGQGQISLNIPFGMKRRIKQRNGNSCSTAMSLGERALQRVDRNEIIPIEKQHKKSKAINPATGHPYFFWFVNNTSHSMGTFESPFPTLLQAQNASSPYDIIYVFPGDGTSSGMNVGFHLQNNQQLLGSSVGHVINTTKGTVNIPAYSNNMPTITNTSSYVVKLASNNVVSGFVIDGTAAPSMNAIDGTTALISNTEITKNLIKTGKGGNGIRFDSNYHLGDITISNCSILGVDATNNVFGIFVNNCSGTNMLISNNIFSGINSLSGLNRAIDIETFSAPTTGTFSLDIINNTITSVVSNSTSVRRAPIHIGNNFSVGNGVALQAMISNNFIDVPSTFAAVAGIYVQQFNSSGPVLPVNITITQNTIKTIPTVPGYLLNNYISTPSAMEVNFGNTNNGSIKIGLDTNPVPVTTYPLFFNQ